MLLILDLTSYSITTSMGYNRIIIYTTYVLKSCAELLKRVLGSADLNLATELHLLLQNNTGTLGDYRDLITGKC